MRMIVRRLFERNGTYAAFLGVVIMAIGGWYFFKHEAIPEYVQVTEGPFETDVTFAGSVVPLERVELSFEVPGRLVYVLDSGNQVKEGDVVARLDTRDIRATIMEAQANLDVANQNVSKLQARPRPEEVSVAKQKVFSAETTLQNSEQTLLNKIQSAYTDARNGVITKADQFFENVAYDPTLIFTSTDSSLQTILENERQAIEPSLREWATRAIIATTTTPSDVLDAKKALVATATLLDHLSDAIRTLSPTPLRPKTTIDGWSASVGTARATITSSLAALITAENTKTTAVSDLTLAKENLALTQTGATEEELREAKAEATAAEATVARFVMEEKKYTLRAPIQGIVSRSLFEIGEVIPAYETVGVVQTEDLYEVKANVSELDIGGLSQGLLGKLTFDAYGTGETFPVSVAKIEPTEELKSGVPTYGVTLLFADNHDPRIRAGLTANVRIRTIIKNSAITIPFQSIVVENGKTGVYRKTMSGDEFTPIVLGARSTDGTVEIVSGITSVDYVRKEP